MVGRQRAESREQNRKGGEGNAHSALDPKIGRDTDAAEPLAPKALRRKARGRAVSPVCRSGGRWRVRQDRRSWGRENAFPTPYPRVRSCEERERREQSVWASVRVDGAKRLRRSRWERGTYERVARGSDRPKACAGGTPLGSSDEHS